MKKLNSYLCYSNYFATGEGNHVWLSLEYAQNKIEAWNKFKIRFCLSNYFMIGAEIIRADERNFEKIKKILNIYFTPEMTEYFWRIIEYKAGDFEMQFDANFS